MIIVLHGCKSSKHSSKRLPGVWQSVPVVVNGKNDEWPSPYPEYDDKAMLGYAVSNDKDNLYITVETGDQATQLKILREGLTVWIDKTGGKDQVMAINYPLPRQNSSGEHSDQPRPPRGQWQQGQGNSQEKRRMELEDRVRKLLPEANEYSLQGFKACNLQYPLMENDSCGIKVRIDLDSFNELIWEAVIPFKSFYFKSQISRADKGKALSVCFETTGAKRPANQGNGGGGNRGGGGGGMRPGMGMGGMGMGMRMGGGGMRGGNRGGGSSSNSQNNIMEPLYKSTTTWKTFGIAWQE